MQTEHHALKLFDIVLSLNGHAIAGPISADVEPGTILTIMGPSGSGKSSLLAFISGTLSPAFEASGRVEAGGIDVTDLPPEKRRLGLLFQDDLLFPHLSVSENLAFGLPAHIKGPARKEAIDGALEEAELAGFGDRDPATLSGGQRSRIALLRTLLSNPTALLLDEPFSRLDSGLRQRVRSFVFGHATSRGLPVLMVTHDPEDAEAAAGSILTL